MTVTDKGKKIIEYRSEKLVDTICNLIKAEGTLSMRVEWVIVLKAETIHDLAMNVLHWLEAHVDTEFLWAKTSTDKGEWFCEIHYICNCEDQPEE